MNNDDETVEVEKYIRKWLSNLDKKIYKDSIEQLELLIQLWKKIYSRIIQQKRRCDFSTLMKMTTLTSSIRH